MKYECSYCDGNRLVILYEYLVHRYDKKKSDYALHVFLDSEEVLHAYNKNNVEKVDIYEEGIWERRILDLFEDETA